MKFKWEKVPSRSNYTLTVDGTSVGAILVGDVKASYHYGVAGYVFALYDVDGTEKATYTDAWYSTLGEAKSDVERAYLEW